jgi:DNA (cytosine-5)-methyltransferase 1
MVTAFVAKHFGGNYTGPGSSPADPLSTITTTDHNALVTSHLIKMKGTNIGQEVINPLQTITAGGLHFGEVRTFLQQYCGTGTDGLVEIDGQQYQIVDIGMRMLEPHELFAAQGFPPEYVIDRDAGGNRYSKAAQVARCGNAVPPPFAEHLVRANLPELCGKKQRPYQSQYQLEMQLM